MHNGNRFRNYRADTLPIEVAGRHYCILPLLNEINIESARNYTEPNRRVHINNLGPANYRHDVLPTELSWFNCYGYPNVTGLLPLTATEVLTTRHIGCLNI